MKRDRSKVLCVLGTRPEAIKMAPVVRALEARPDRFEVKVCVTGQHRQMLDPMLALFGMAPDHDLDVMREHQSLMDITLAVLEGLERVLEAEQPDWVLVQGDTTTTMAASLAAFYAGVRVGHVEAGLRTWNMGEPWPEEMNRRVADVLADLHFAPTEVAAANLRAEGIGDETIVVTGNTGVDAFRIASELPFDPSGTWLEELADESLRVVLVTVHRRENHGVAIGEICAGIRAIARNAKDVRLVVPVHLNPNVRGPVQAELGGLPNVRLVEPLEYRPTVWLLQRSHFVITDSGGLQEEAVGAGKPVLVLRETTERVEGVEAGTARLVGWDRGELAWWAARLLHDEQAYERMARASKPYGDGHAGDRIAAALEKVTDERDGGEVDELLHALEPDPNRRADVESHALAPR